MRVLQVKEYHAQIADKKWADCDKSKCMPTMFYFYKEDESGCPTEKRKNGYIAYNETKAVWAMGKLEAIAKFNGFHAKNTRPV